MPSLRRVLTWIARLSCAHPKIVLCFFLVAAIAGFAAMPFIKISTDLTSGVAYDNPTIKLARECLQTFGEQDSLIVVIQFPEPPGRDRLFFMRSLESFIAAMPGVRRARCQFLDTQDKLQVEAVLTNFLLGLNSDEKDQISVLFSEQHMEDALRRTRNRLFLIQDSDLKDRILEDPLELGHFVAESMKKRVGSVSLNDMFLLIGSPDSTVFLIQVTPAFPSSDITSSGVLINELKKSLPSEISRLVDERPGLWRYKDDIQWWLTGKTLFHHESNEVFREESLRILVCSVLLVSILLWVAYRSLWAGVLLLVPIAAGVGPNYGLLCLVFDEVNPVVMGAAGVLFGLATDYGVHIWARLSDELEKTPCIQDALLTVYEQTGPAVTLGALTCIIAFLCMCFSHQPAMKQLGYVGAMGLILSLGSTLFLCPALATVLGVGRRHYFPKMKFSFARLSHLYEMRPWITVVISLCMIGVGAWYAMRVSEEKDMFKVFLARNMESTNISDFISRKFKTNFAQPVLIVFDADDFDRGLNIQREIDVILSDLMRRKREIASADSISYLMSPSSVRNQNLQWVREVAEGWPRLYTMYSRILAKSDLSESSTEQLLSSFSALGQLLDKLSSQPVGAPFSRQLEDSWYSAKIGESYRFLTYVRYSHTITDPEESAMVDRSIRNALSGLPVSVQVIGVRQAMNKILSTLLSELVKIALYTIALVLVFFTAVLRRPLAVLLSLIPMVGAFAITLGTTAIVGLGLPFSVVGVAPLIFGLGMDNGVHVVVGSLSDKGGVRDTLEHVASPIIFTSLANVSGFVAMLASRLYALEFLGWAIIVGMSASVCFTLTTLPAILLIRERKRSNKHETVQTL